MNLYLKKISQFLFVFMLFSCSKEEKLKSENSGVRQLIVNIDNLSLQDNGLNKSASLKNNKLSDQHIVEYGDGWSITYSNVSDKQIDNKMANTIPSIGNAYTFPYVYGQQTLDGVKLPKGIAYRVHAFDAVTGKLIDQKIYRNGNVILSAAYQDLKTPSEDPFIIPNEYKNVQLLAYTIYDQSKSLEDQLIPYNENISLYKNTTLMHNNQLDTASYKYLKFNGVDGSRDFFIAQSTVNFGSQNNIIINNLIFNLLNAYIGLNIRFAQYETYDLLLDAVTTVVSPGNGRYDYTPYTDKYSNEIFDHGSLRPIPLRFATYIGDSFIAGPHFEEYIQYEGTKLNVQKMDLPSPSYQFFVRQSFHSMKYKDYVGNPNPYEFNTANSPYLAQYVPSALTQYTSYYIPSDISSIYGMYDDTTHVLELRNIYLRSKADPSILIGPRDFQILIGANSTNGRGAWNQQIVLNYVP